MTIFQFANAGRDLAGEGKLFAPIKIATNIHNIICNLRPNFHLENFTTDILSESLTGRIGWERVFSKRTGIALEIN